MGRAEVRYLAGARHGDAELGVFRWSMDARRSGPDPHFHRTMSESFYVLAGSVRIFDGRSWVDCSPGDFVHVPPGGVHGFRNESGAPAEMLILFAPGAPREGYFEELADSGASGRRLDDAEWARAVRPPRPVPGLTHHGQARAVAAKDASSLCSGMTHSR
jgi:quercetin dioxygenase-like cupin family protein